MIHLSQWHAHCASNTDSEHPCLQECLYPWLVPALDNDMVGNSVDDTLLLWYGQLGLQCCPQHVDVAINLLDSCLAKVAASLLQGVDRELVGGCPCYKVWEIGGDFGLSKSRSARRQAY